MAICAFYSAFFFFFPKLFFKLIFFIHFLEQNTSVYSHDKCALSLHTLHDILLQFDILSSPRAISISVENRDIVCKLENIPKDLASVIILFFSFFFFFRLPPSESLSQTYTCTCLCLFLCVYVCIWPSSGWKQG